MKGKRKKIKIFKISILFNNKGTTKTSKKASSFPLNVNGRKENQEKSGEMSVMGVIP